MIELANIRLSLDAGVPGTEGERLVRRAAARACGVGEAQVSDVRLIKRSVDARRKSDVHFVATLGVSLADPTAEAHVIACGSREKGVSVRAHKPYEPLEIPDCSSALAAGECLRPVVVGTGPAGLFCALALARAGLRPLVLERGDRVDRRIEAVDRFARGGAFDPESNVQFGEGGAGTFSDGKLTTNVKNPLAPHVIAWFVKAGAPSEISWEAKPHIGTDRLRGVVCALRKQIEAAGGEVRFRSKLAGMECDASGHVVAVAVEDGVSGACERVRCDRVVVACGHSARDTFAMLHDAGFAMERKPFSVGVRIEHDQQAIDRAQYGSAAGHPALGPADYKLAVHLPNGRGVYTFCMCPGGEVVAATSEENAVVVNGMSAFARDEANANSAVLVGVDPDDFGDEGGVLAGVEFQRRLERAAYACAREAGGKPYAAPAQRVGDFLAAAGDGVRSDAGAGADATVRPVVPSYSRGVVWCDLRDCLPAFVADSIAQALPLFDAKLHGFADAEAVMTGVETRSSSPVRIIRGTDLQAFASRVDRGGCTEGISDAHDPKADAGATGVYPCGEGAGYAGGIMSAAIDGLRVALAIAREVTP